MRRIKCDECGRMFRPGNDKAGIPNGVGFQLKDGTILNVCSNCIMKEGREARGQTTCYAILVKGESGAALMNHTLAKVVRDNKGAFVQGGYDFTVYCACFVFKTRLQMERVASTFEQYGIVYDTRDDAIVDSKFM